MLQGTAALALVTVMTTQAGATQAASGSPLATSVTPGPAPIEASAVPLAPAGPVPPPVVELGPTPGALRPEPPPHDGRGLLIAAGVMGGVNIGLVAARLALGLGEPTVAGEQARLILTVVATPIDVAAGIGLAAGGGHLRGRSDGYRSAFDGVPKLRASAFTGSGVALMVMGAIGWASAWTPWHGDASLEARGGGSLVVESIGSLLMMGGTGLVAYGVSWKRHTLLYSRSRPLGLRPTLAPGFVGLALGGRF